MSMDTPADFGKGPAAEVRRWLKELDLSDKTEQDWRNTADKIWKRYRSRQRKKNSFNILWSNTETLAPALFNTPPAPDVRRRFRDDDPVGKAVSTMLERCLEFQTDTEQFMRAIKQDVLDAILPGRGVSRVKYCPSFAPMAPVVAPEAPEQGQEDTAYADEEEQVAWEQAEVEHVQWDDFRRGPGKDWCEVQWVAFRHRMNKEELMELVADQSIDVQNAVKAIPVDDCEDDDIKKDESMKTVFGTVEVWEMWCKEYRQVKYVTKAYRANFLKSMDDPLGLIDFFPCARPLYAIQDSSSLVPLPLFEQYCEQADELDMLSSRINRIVNALKVRGVYDSTIAELGELMRADDNKLIPTQNAALWLDKGGLEKAIYWMPIEQAAGVLQALYQAREACKVVIYELTGIADVRRGTSDAQETLGAQKLKADFGNQRISGLRLEVQRYVRDTMRLMSEIVAEKFSPDTLLRMSQMKIPTNQEIQQKIDQTLMQANQQAQMQGQPPPPPQQVLQSLGPRPVSLEQVIDVLHDDATRMFKIDVETDSMISATISEDMQGLRDVLAGVTQFMQGIAPAVQAGFFPAEAAKEIVMTITRRSKMGSAVEDALDKMQAPQQQVDPRAQQAQAQAQADAQKAQIKAQSDMQVAQMKVESDAKIAQIEAQAQQQTDIVRQQAEQQQHQLKIDSEARLSMMKQEMDDRFKMMEMQFRREEAELKAATAIQVATINSAAKGVIQMTPATQAASDEIATELPQ